MGGLSESIKKGKIVTKSFFSDNVEWGSKNLGKMIYADVKVNKRSGGCILQIFIRSSKLQNVKCKMQM